MLDRNAFPPASRTFPLSQGRSPPGIGGRLIIDRAREVSQEDDVDDDDEDTLHSIVAAPQRRRSSVAGTHSIAHYERAERLFSLRLRVHRAPRPQAPPPPSLYSCPPEELKDTVSKQLESPFSCFGVIMLLIVPG